MENYLTRILATSIIIALTIVVHVFVKKSIKKVGKKYGFKPGRAKTIIKLLNLSTNFVIFMVILSIWGIDKKELSIFLSSFLAILGVALVAQWSMLSNITASIVLFINHPARIDDEITFLDKDVPLTGIIKDIGAFFMIIETPQKELITLPNNLIFQKMVKIVHKEVK
jgi:small-conductance mechanosensitive channel